MDMTYSLCNKKLSLFALKPHISYLVSIFLV